MFQVLSSPGIVGTDSLVRHPDGVSEDHAGRRFRCAGALKTPEVFHPSALCDALMP
jgi:hypothetical protein